MHKFTIGRQQYFIRAYTLEAQNQVHEASLELLKLDR